MALAQGFEVLDKAKHDTKSFDCGKPVMNEFLYRHAYKQQDKGVSRTWVLIEKKPATAKAPVAAYFTLKSSNINKSDVPLGGGYPQTGLPVVLLAKLAVDNKYRGTGLGAKALVYAIRQAVTLTTVGLNAVGIILDVLDADALGFYQNMGIFDEFTNDPMRLFITMKEASQL